MAALLSSEMPDDEIARRGLAIYEKRLRDLLEPDRTGEQLAINVDDGDYEVAGTAVEADRRLRRRHPEGVFCLLEVGQPLAPWPWQRDVPAGKH